MATNANNNIMELTKELFFTTADEADLVLVDFFATWCPPCETQGEILHDEGQKIIEKFPQIKLTKFNTGKDGGISDDLEIKAIPTIVIIYKKMIGKMHSGVKTIDDIIKFIEGLVKKIDANDFDSSKVTISDIKTNYQHRKDAELAKQQKKEKKRKPKT